MTFSSSSFSLHFPSLACTPVPASCLSPQVAVLHSGSCTHPGCSAEPLSEAMASTTLPGVHLHILSWPHPDHSLTCSEGGWNRQETGTKAALCGRRLASSLNIDLKCLTQGHSPKPELFPERRQKLRGSCSQRGLHPICFHCLRAISSWSSRSFFQAGGQE